MPSEKRKCAAIKAAMEKRKKEVFQTDYPWNPRAPLHVVNSVPKAPFTRASIQYRALLQNRETD